jgi:predicted CopG family antitoxin
MANRKISISFKEKYLHVYLYLQQMKDRKENVSDYICKLIEKDINNGRDFHSLEDIRKIVLEILQANGHTFTNPSVPFSTISNEKLSNEDIDLLNRIF